MSIIDETSHGHSDISTFQVLASCKTLVKYEPSIELSSPPARSKSLVIFFFSLLSHLLSPIFVTNVSNCR